MKFGRENAVACWAISLVICLAAMTVGCQPAQKFNGQVLEEVAPAPALEGLNWDGERFSLAELEGKVVVVFFGYTMCPDVCPFTLAKMKQVSSKLGDRSEDFAVVFVSVDPHRDTREKMRRYVPNFDPRFYGLRLEFDELDTVQEAWDLTVQYGQPKDGPGTDSFYYVDHTGTFFVVDRQGNLKLTFPPNATVEEMVPDIEALLAG